ncbi:hypothetical protein RSOLAG22IIIB_10348 [Rhizoctonia solani]|uniref:Protein kinase domain-containing protein n=1 Tax=Rhizoctonia solani TaxID=456999 RepID=A0A0K6G2X0_9AGAM|nr:hypothetical protein RSOLAG22IIIB_10348 [Rhizoctonia solani]
MALVNPFYDLDFVSESSRRSEVEMRWVSFQPYLLSKGYRLRPRYQPHWVPSWKGTPVNPDGCEDSFDCMPIHVLDATRIQDDQQVMIKMVVPWKDGREGREELALMEYFSAPPVRDEHDNHVVPCLDIFPIPGVVSGHFLVTPLLGRYKDVPFYNLAEVHDMFLQLFDGLLHMHRNRVAHCDIDAQNIMMDLRPLYDEHFHPFHRTYSTDFKRHLFPHATRTQKGTRYYYIDLGFAIQFKDHNSPRTVSGVYSRVPAPEQLGGRPFDPFLADVYQFGQMLMREFIPQIKGLDFLIPLAMEMTRNEPDSRPTLEHARKSMNTAFLGLGWRAYNWPLLPPNAPRKVRILRVLFGVMKDIQLVMSHFLRMMFFWRI